jgi:hypothetical protein
VCEKGTLLISTSDFAANSISIPVIRQLYPVNFHREFGKKTAAAQRLLRFKNCP